uniref:Uncharacterized protein n=1 Tax=Odontella aurita TaxID=265563 RepID=A0A7S4JCM5_9STRA|mmetsp:Transcript_43808/g.133327  ORF Transcript_43808/g.133327 Transcript_43808/m.133327 type:complete len:126 (+) Transcript_43808:693-1070(+)
MIDSPNAVDASPSSVAPVGTNESATGTAAAAAPALATRKVRRSNPPPPSASGGKLTREGAIGATGVVVRVLDASVSPIFSPLLVLGRRHRDSLARRAPIQSTSGKESAVVGGSQVIYSYERDCVC